MREGSVKILPGFDGVYGVPVFNSGDEEKLNQERFSLVEKQDAKETLKKDEKKYAKENNKKPDEKNQKTLSNFM